MPQRNLAIVRSLHDAFGRGDLPAVLELLDANVVIHHPESLPIGGTYHGHSGLQEIAAKLGAAFERVSFPLESLTAEQDIVIIRERLEGIAAGSRQAVSMPVVEVVTLREGTVISLTVFYWDTVALRTALGG